MNKSDVTSHSATAGFSVTDFVPETGGQFSMGQNFPNPYEVETVIPFTLNNSSDVVLSLYNIMGQKVIDLMQYGLPAGAHTITVNTTGLGISQVNYIYQLEVSNDNGSFRQSKMMTVR